jgi:urease gamma subunit
LRLDFTYQFFSVAAFRARKEERKRKKRRKRKKVNLPNTINLIPKRLMTGKREGTKYGNEEKNENEEDT